ncbi:MAG: ABC transporter ATP-binding protein [Actinomycetia bacterium]|nr:ABC transporter ATP-binding protein [Actinomycetes bacterium]
MALLETHALSKNFGGLAAVSDLDLAVDEGEILGLIGPNGAGKSTFLNLIDGTLRASGGHIVFRGRDITRYSPHRRAGLGIARVFQRNALFRSMTVLENVLAGSFLHTDHGPFSVLVRSLDHVRKDREVMARCMDLLTFVGLQDKSHMMATSLPHGSQRELCVAVALASDPAVLLLDEPLTGMNAEETASMIEIIKTLNREKGTTTIVVEHNVKAVLGLCARAVVLNYGQKLIEGTPRECVADPAVIEAYLGADADVF